MITHLAYLDIKCKKVFEDIDNLKQVNQVVEKKMYLLGTGVSKNRLSIDFLTNQINEYISGLNNKLILYLIT